MNLPQDDFATRRALLATDIARQRGELATAYANLEKPIRYTEYGMRGIGFIRSNPWVIAAAPTVVSLVMNFFGRKKIKPPPVAPAQQQSMGKQPKGFKGAVVKGAGFAWQAFQLYRRVRPYFL